MQLGSPWARQRYAIDNAVTVASSVTLSIGENVNVFTNALMEMGMISLYGIVIANGSEFTALPKFLSKLTDD